MNDINNQNLCPKDRTKALLAELSPEEKMAQVICCFLHKLGDTLDTLARRSALARNQ